MSPVGVIVRIELQNWLLWLLASVWRRV